MTYIISINAEHNFEITGDEAAYEVYTKACEFAETIGARVDFLDAETGEVLASFGDDEDYEPDDDYEPGDIDSDFGYDPYCGCYTYDCQQVSKKVEKSLDSRLKTLYNDYRK